MRIAIGKFISISLIMLTLISSCKSTNKKSKIPANFTGDSEIYWNDGSIKGKGKFVNGKKEGKWILFYKSSGEKLAEGQFKNDLKTGKWIYFDKNGNKSMEGNFEDDQKVGEWVAYYPDGNIMWKTNYILKVKHIKSIGIKKKLGVINGLKRWFYKNGKVWKEEYYRDSILNGRFQEYYQKGNPKIITMYKDGKLNGRFNKWYENGKMQQFGFYKNDIKEGLWKFYYDNGQLMTIGNFSKNKASGNWKYYSKSGLLQKEGKFINGKEAGLWKFYAYDLPKSKRRLLAMELALKGGMIDNSYEKCKIYDESGKLLGIGQLTGIPKAIYKIYKDGNETGTIASSQNPKDDIKSHIKYEWTGKWQKPKKNGKWTEYYPGTKFIKFVANYTMDKLNGKYIEYYPNGNVKAEGEYLSNKKNGEWKFYESNGLLDTEMSGKYILDKKINF